MKIKQLTINLNQQEALDLRSLLNGFKDMQNQLGIGEGSSRMILLENLLAVLPRALQCVEPIENTKTGLNIPESVIAR